MVTFNWYQRCWYIFLILELIRQKYETQSILLSRKKSAQILRPQKKVCNMLK